MDLCGQAALHCYCCCWCWRLNELSKNMENMLSHAQWRRNVLHMPNITRLHCIRKNERETKRKSEKTMILIHEWPMQSAWFTGFHSRWNAFILNVTSKIELIGALLCLQNGCTNDHSASPTGLFNELFEMNVFNEWMKTNHKNYRLTLVNKQRMPTTIKLNQHFLPESQRTFFFYWKYNKQRKLIEIVG